MSNYQKSMSIGLFINNCQLELSSLFHHLESESVEDLKVSENRINCLSYRILSNYQGYILDSSLSLPKISLMALENSDILMDIQSHIKDV